MLIVFVNLFLPFCFDGKIITQGFLSEFMKKTNKNVDNTPILWDLKKKV